MAKQFYIIVTRDIDLKTHKTICEDSNIGYRSYQKALYHIDRMAIRATTPYGWLVRVKKVEKYTESLLRIIFEDNTERQVFIRNITIK